MRGERLGPGHHAVPAPILADPRVDEKTAPYQRCADHVLSRRRTG